MTRDIERNDVDISQLYKWKRRINIYDPYTDTTVYVYMRIVGDVDINKAKTYGYRKAAELRKSLRKEGSDERLAFLAELEDYKEDASILVKSIILLELPQMYQEAMNNAVLPEPRQPKADAPQEKFEEYQAEVDSYPDRFAEETTKELEKLQSSRKRSLSKTGIEKLYKIYEETVINRLCEEELSTAYYQMCVYFGTYKDEEYKERAFESFEEYENAHKDLKTRLYNEYRDLELGISTLKKLPGATE